jgi:uncharacterized membrane protein YeaQ/YmgE (transglycosylase-associated protein family)
MNAGWIFLFVGVGVLAGWIAGRFMRGNGFGLVGDILVGIAGALVGGYGFAAAGLDFGGGLPGRLVVALGTALLLLFVVRLFTGRRSGRRIWS